MVKDKILCVVYNHNKNENSKLWLDRLSKYYETYIFDSGSDEPIEDEHVIKFGNIYWGGMFNESVKLLNSEGKEYEWLFVVCDDILCDDENFGKLVDSMNRVMATNNIGEYQPSSTSGSHNIWENNKNRATGQMRVTYDIEGWMFLVRKDVVDKICTYGIDFYEDMKFGWGIDVLLSNASLKMGYLNVVDDTVIVEHPDADRGYCDDDNEVFIEMSNAFAKIGETYASLVNENVNIVKGILSRLNNTKTNFLPFISISDMACEIMNNFSKIPHDVIGVIGIMRSGMLPASIVSEKLNVGLATVEEFESCGIDIFQRHGLRKMQKPKDCNKILVVDDTCYHGLSISKIKKRFSAEKFKEYEFIYLVVYKEGDCSLDKPDIYLKDITESAKKSDSSTVIYEWNIFSNPSVISKTMFDLDGVLCNEPPDERNVNEYLEYIEDPIPLFVPTSDKITVVTYRLEKYREQTEKYLHKIGIDADIQMFPSESYDDRAKTTPWEFKGEKYKNSSDFILFIESDDYQAKQICGISGKPVYCVGTNTMYYKKKNS